MSNVCELFSSVALWCHDIDLSNTDRIELPSHVKQSHPAHHHSPIIVQQHQFDKCAGINCKK